MTRCKFRDELLLNPYELPLAVCVLIVALVFTVFPEALEHSPVSFETRGILHHCFHYLLLFGAASNLAGRVVRRPAVALWMQFSGLAMILAALALNLTALVAADFDGSSTMPVGGLDVALRVALMVGMSVRLWIIGTRATVELGALHE